MYLGENSVHVKYRLYFKRIEDQTKGCELQLRKENCN